MEQACNSLKLRKAVGVDLIPNEVLKQPALQEIMLNFMNSCFSYHTIPSAWQKAVISPIPKSASKDPYTPLNYRGISLLSCVYKLYSRLINGRLSGRCESHDLLVDEQNGFRPDRACMDHVYVLSSIIRNRKCDNMPTFAAFIDMKKAFDWVDRDLLFYKIMKNFNITGKMYVAIVSLYSDSSACVKLNALRTDWFDISSGVKQGDTFSPTLFNMYLNDLATEIKLLNAGVELDDCTISLLLYADDIVLIAPDEVSLQTQLNAVYQWCRRWHMLVNEDKTQIVHFRPAGSAATDFRFIYGSHKLAIVNEYKYLGVFFDEHLSFSSNADALAASAGRALGLLRYKLKFLKECGCSTYTQLFSSYICPILDYCAGIWGMKYYDSLERVQLNALRYFLGVHKYAANDFLIGEAGWISCHARHQLAALRLWNRFINLPSFRITTRVFLWDLSQCDKVSSWSCNTRNIFINLDMLEKFDSIEYCDLQICYEKLKSNETEKWNVRRTSKPKLRYYNMFKSDLEIEDYLFFKVPKMHRSLLAQFRAGILPLSIEVGRYRNIPLEERLCTLCDDNVVEDEIHFLCSCKLYKEARDVLFVQAAMMCDDFCRMDVLDKFVYMMSNMQKEVMSFIVQASHKRRTKLYSRL